MQYNHAQHINRTIQGQRAKHDRQNRSNTLVQYHCTAPCICHTRHADLSYLHKCVLIPESVKKTLLKKKIHMGISAFRAPNQQFLLLDCRARACAKGVFLFTDTGIVWEASPLAPTAFPAPWPGGCARGTLLSGRLAMRNRRCTMPGVGSSMLKPSCSNIC